MNLNEVTAYEVIQKKKLTDIRSTGYLLQAHQDRSEGNAH